MTAARDLRHLEAALDLMARTDPLERLQCLKALCVTYGLWTIPEPPTLYSPVIYEIQLFGVAAMASDIEALPRNWMRAARNVLDGLDEGQAA
ncbi:hypothetical protein [Pseudaestuariivita rosea]|uniref:hypothetical protein n=1 Tax=Pseudaestuariivita rosea TaxID=2763263 RepID=UPI001ABA4040|nr:hypothetical protein [Pseudaestuariivita rosea]